MEGDNIYSQNIYNNFNIQRQLLLLNLFVYPNFAEEKYLKTLLSVVQYVNYFYLCSMQRRKCVKQTYLMKVFSQSLIENVEVFISKRTTNSTHFLYSYVAVRFLRTYPILSKCGVSYRLFLLGSFHNLRLDKRNQLHTFCFYTNKPAFWS